MEPLKRVPDGRRVLLALTMLATAFPCPPAFADAQEPPGDYIFQMAKVDYLLRQREFTRAAKELGRMPKERHDDALFERYVERALVGLFGPQTLPHIVRNRLRVTRHKKDASANSDQSSDPDGLHVSEHVDADVQGRHGVRGKFVMDVEGFKDGHSDVRYRTLLADFYKDGNHFAIGDSASYPSPYFLRGSRLRGLQAILPGDHHEFQALMGAYPVWLE